VPRIAEFVPLTPQAIRKVGHRYMEGGLERAVFEKELPGAAGLLKDSESVTGANSREWLPPLRF
jgi:putative transposase